MTDEMTDIVDCTNCKGTGKVVICICTAEISGGGYSLVRNPKCRADHMVKI